MSKIDINEVASHPNIALSIVSTQSEDPKDAQLRRTKDLITFSVAVVFIISAFIYCGIKAFDSQSSPDDKKWCLTIEGIIIGGLLGYITGKKYR
ncbi:MAG: hypothetical protein AB7F64_06420, partial [Gammaproteobacteria bacterium]